MYLIQVTSEGPIKIELNQEVMVVHGDLVGEVTFIGTCKGGRETDTWVKIPNIVGLEYMGVAMELEATEFVGKIYRDRTKTGYGVALLLQQTELFGKTIWFPYAIGGIVS